MGFSGFSPNWLSLGLKRAHEQQSSLKSDQLHISAVNLQRKRDNSEVRAAKIVKNSQQERELDWYSTQHMHVEEDTALAQMSSNALAFQEKGPNAESVNTRHEQPGSTLRTPWNCARSPCVPSSSFNKDFPFYHPHVHYFPDNKHKSPYPEVGRCTSDIADEAEALMEEGRLLARVAELRSRREVKQAGSQGLNMYRHTFQDFPSCKWWDKSASAANEGKRGEAEAAKHEADEQWKELDRLMKKASLSLASSNSMQHANVLESHLETELSKLESRRDSILHIARQTATACSQDIGDEGNQVDVADGKEKYDEGPVMDLVSSDEESNAETSAGEFEGPIFDDLLEMYISDQDSGLQPLTDAQQSVYSIAMEGDETEAVAIHPYSNVTLLRKDMRRILPGEWLSDEVINTYMKLLQERDGRLRKLSDQLLSVGREDRCFPKCHFFSSFFYNKLYMDRGQYDYTAVQRWTRKARLLSGSQESDCILDCDLIFVPVHQTLHWCMAVINLRDKCLSYYDSLHGEDHNCLKHLAWYVRDEAKDKKKLDLDISKWPRLFPKDVPRQENGFDCGMFAVKFADYESRGRAFQFRQQDMGYFRRRMVAELMQMFAN